MKLVMGISDRIYVVNQGNAAGERDAGNRFVTTRT
ncbi:Uncharacterised protein [Citrobacter freundii]|nr:Uncharacterised protein [Citrobacter freundii]